MVDPGERQMALDLEGGPYLSGCGSGWWERVDKPVPAWPMMLFWISAAKRPNGPDRFVVRLDCVDYPREAPTGTMWDLETDQQLAAAKWPKGTGNVQAVFNPGWEGGRALYHPLDRVAMRGHGDWPTKYPCYVWKNDRNVTRYLTMVFRLLQSSEYTGV